MSIEKSKDRVYDAFWATVRANVEEQTGFNPEFDQIINTKLPEAALDRLILEVKASMPCYNVFYGDFALTCDRTEGVIKICPSCEARQKLGVDSVSVP